MKSQCKVIANFCILMIFMLMTGLSMRPVESEASGSWFTFDHSPTYQQVQMRFLSAVESLNPDSIGKYFMIWRKNSELILIPI